MKKLIIGFSILFCFNLNAQKGKLYMSTWNESGDTEINIPIDKYIYFKKGKLYYCISNNSEKIILFVKIEDSGVQDRILKQGLTVWINMDGKSLKENGIRFPVGSQYFGGRNRPNLGGSNIDQDGKPLTPLSMANTIELVGFSNEEMKRIPAENSDSFNGSVKYNNEGLLIYKMVMPIAKLAVRNSKDGDGAMPFIFGIEYGAPPVIGPGGGSGARPGSSPSSDMSRGGSSGGGRPGGGGGRPGGGGPPSGSMAAQDIIPPVLTWIKNVKLADGR